MIDPEREKEIRARQQSRARIMGLMLAALVVLFFFVTIAKIRHGG